MTSMSTIEPSGTPRKVLLFSGHMIDSPTRPRPRFPPQLEPLARSAISGVLTELAAGPGDLAICGGACGGDLLFAEESLSRGVPVELYLPFAVAEFVTRSVSFAGGHWQQRFESALAASALHVMPVERGARGTGRNPYEENNLWMLEAASRFGQDKLDFIALWDGEGGDGEGGTQHMLEQVSHRGGRVHRIDIRELQRLNRGSPPGVSQAS
jgi:hypothetical protein